MFFQAGPQRAPNYHQRRHRTLEQKLLGSLKQRDPRNQNITKEERKALGELKKSKDLLIMGADKGKCTVVQGKEDCEKKVNEMLSDKNTYEKLSKDPTPKYKRKLLDILKRLKTENKIDEGAISAFVPYG